MHFKLIGKMGAGAEQEYTMDKEKKILNQIQPVSCPAPISLYFSAFLYISLHFSTFLCISLYFPAFLCISLHFTAFHCVSLNFTFYILDNSTERTVAIFHGASGLTPVRNDYYTHLTLYDNLCFFLRDEYK